MSILRNKTNRHVIWGWLLLRGTRVFFHTYSKRKIYVVQKAEKRKFINITKWIFTVILCIFILPKFFYSPTDVQEFCFKQNIKIYFQNAPTCFGLITIIRERTIWDLLKLLLLKQSESSVSPLNAKLNPIYHLLTLLGVHHFLHVSRIRVKSSTLRLLMSYIYIWSTHSWCF
jgi:hypothetical protein